MKRALMFLVCAMAFAMNRVQAEDKPETPRIESVGLAKVQPHEKNPATIWYDNFDGGTPWKYMEPKQDSASAKLSEKEALGGAGKSMECFYAQGKQGEGNRKIVFGDCPNGEPLRKSEKFEEIYWRVYVKHQKGWSGAPDKLSRATGMVSNKWDQAFIMHVWSAGDPLTLDPATGVRDGKVVTTKYNDFPNLRWLGNSPKGKFPLHATEESGRWVCVEAHLKLNTPGKKDGLAGLWIDGKLDAERQGMDYRGTYTDHTINAVFLEAYWNKGSTKDQYRWYDDFVVSTQPIGPITAEKNPVLIKTPAEGIAAWEAEISADAEGKKVVWRSKPAPGKDVKLIASATTGAFEGDAQGKPALPKGPMYFCRVRQKNAAGAWSEWSGWHQPFYVE